MLKNKNHDKMIDLSLLIEQHKKEIWAYKMKESEWVKTQNQLEGAKRIIEDLSGELLSYKKQLEECQNEMSLLKGIGLNSPEMKALQSSNKHLKEQVEAYRIQLKKAGL
jgi:hypothetical protein|tara:strand:- start:329 stop:655 length:327 start_codon:yes stop_codon:yes gene_type:complete